MKKINLIKKNLQLQINNIVLTKYDFFTDKFLLRIDFFLLCFFFYYILILIKINDYLSLKI